MDELIKFHFENFDALLKNEKSEVITDKIEKQINEIRENLKNTFNQESDEYVRNCHYLDKKFDEYIEDKKN